MITSHINKLNSYNFYLYVIRNLNGDMKIISNINKLRYLSQTIRPNFFFAYPNTILKKDVIWLSIEKTSKFILTRMIFK